MDKKDITAIVLNPAARDGKASENWPFIEKTLRHYGINFEKFDTDRDSAKTIDSVKEIAEMGFGRIVAVGGDGTQNLIINGIMRAKVETRPEYALFPCGTANDIGGSFDIRMPNFSKKEIETCIRTLARGTLYNLDLGLVNSDTYFADSFGIGFDASVLKDRNATRHDRPFMRTGKQSYIPSILGEMAGNYVAPHAQITIDGNTKTTKLFNMVINDTQIYAGEFKLHPDIRANDGLLDVNYFWDFQSYLSEFGSHGIDQVSKRIDPTGLSGKAMRMVVENSKHYQAKNIEITLDQVTPTQIDGEEYCPGDHFTITCVKHALKLVIPYER